MKKVGLIGLMALLLTVSLFAFTGCKSDGENGTSDENKFVGEFKSSWIDVDNSDADQKLSFILTLKESSPAQLKRTAYLERYAGEKLEWIKGGTWQGTADKQNYSVICRFAMDAFNNTLSTYLTLTLLEDDSLLGAPSLTTTASGGILSCMGNGTYMDNTIIIFNPEPPYTQIGPTPYSYIISAAIFTKSQ